jgi:hypothetical protein
MLSILLFLAGAVALIAGVSYFIFTYGNYVVDFFNSLISSWSSVTDLLPSWLLPFATIPILLFIVGVLVKVF